MGASSAEGQDPAGDPTPGQPELNTGLQDRNLILAVQTAPVHHEDAPLPRVPGSEHEPLHSTLRLLAGEPVEVHVVLPGDLPVPELADEPRIEGRQMSLDELVGVREIEGR